MGLRVMEQGTQLFERPVGLGNIFITVDVAEGDDPEKCVTVSKNVAGNLEVVIEMGTEPDLANAITVDVSGAVPAAEGAMKAAKKEAKGRKKTAARKATRKTTAASRKTSTPKKTSVTVETKATPTGPVTVASDEA